jgi:hypothetical protein
MTHPATAPHATLIRKQTLHGRQRLPVCVAVDYQRLARLHWTTVAGVTEDGEAAVAHHASSAAEDTLSTHLRELTPAPCCIRRPLRRRASHLRKRRALFIPIFITSRADDTPVRKPPHRWKEAPVEEVVLRHSHIHRWPGLPAAPSVSSHLHLHLRLRAGALAPRRCRSLPPRSQLHRRSRRMTVAGDPQTPLPHLKMKAFPRSK